MSTLDKLRALHKEVCVLWRRYYEDNVPEGEAEVLNLGFLILEKFVEANCATAEERHTIDNVHNVALRNYFNRVHSQFDSDADIVIKGE